ncbi:hypothetical protein EHQ81_18810 [Leptospira selangorensis]|uniref:Uncharacterized protein n=1 Tax=Leptospira selangorensis TaxID=2484982 RepID=A0A5F2C538_9LEPT|nr:hypothetical protein [Leptospira selangorensis]TGM10866.1 hypothetical protein EHQ81_18810 [Leptospira selangorensis]TGM26901.1 hypothetical protein EHQ82_02530 [Leptospira selangorensis]
MQNSFISEFQTRKSTKYIPLFLFFLILLGTCSKFRVDDYNPYLYGRVKLGKDLKELQVSIVNRVPTNVPNQVAIASGVIYVPDFEQSLIKAFNSDGDLKFVVGNSKEKQDKVKTYNIKLGRIGLVTVSDGDDIFVQSRISKEDVKADRAAENIYTKKSGEFRTEAEEAVPSVILKINDSGKLSQTIYADGVGGSTPFGYVERMEAGNNDLLFVFHRQNGGMKLSIFDEAGKLKQKVDASDFKDFLNTQGDVYTWYVDSFISHPDGEYVLGSFSFYETKSGRFKNRKILRYDLKDKKISPVKEIQDPSETLYWVLNNDNFFIWETEVEEGNSIRLQVHDEDGNHVNNIRLNYPPPRGLWRETWMDTNDEIYSMKIRAGYLEIHKWK